MSIEVNTTPDGKISLRIIQEDGKDSVISLNNAPLKKGSKINLHVNPIISAVDDFVDEEQKVKSTMLEPLFICPKPEKIESDSSILGSGACRLNAKDLIAQLKVKKDRKSSKKNKHKHKSSRKHDSSDSSSSSSSLVAERRHKRKHK